MKIKFRTKMSAVLLGIVLGLDLSILVAKIQSNSEPEGLVMLIAIFLVIANFWDEKEFRQFSRFLASMIGGITVRECTQISIDWCFIISVVTIAVMSIVAAYNGMVNPRPERNKKKAKAANPNEPK